MQKPRIVLDIRPPQKAPASVPRPSLGTRIRTVPVLRAAPRPRFFSFRVVFLIVGITLLTMGTFYGVGIWSFKTNAETSAGIIFEKFKEAEEAFRALEPERAKRALEDIHGEVSGIAAQADRTGLTALASLWGEFTPRFKAAPALLKELLSTSGNAIAIAEDLEIIKHNLFDWLFNDKGELLVERMTHLAKTVSALIASGASLEKEGRAAGVPLPPNALSLTANLYEQEQVLRFVTEWLAEPRDHHLLILFQNPSEIRPAGGFLGSYAELTLRGGTIQNLKVWDIYDPDGQLDERIIPPKQLQTVTPRWGARDANWFFDFPTSAKKVAELLEASKIYREQNREFEAVIAVNVNVIQSILGIVGPLTLPEYGFVITPENFLTEVQREVEAGEDKAHGEPKRILKVLTPLLLERLGSLDDAGKRNLVQTLGEHFTGKDIMVFSRDLVIQNYLRGRGVTGDVAELPVGFQGEYLAVVNTNVAGGKSDLYITQNVKLVSNIDEQGVINNALTVERAHTGGNAKDPWHRATNKIYLKAFTPRDSTLTHVEGNTIRTIVPPLDYAAAGYTADADVKRIEDTATSFPLYGAEAIEESGKTAFGVWLTTPPNTAKTLQLYYRNPIKLNLKEPEIPYAFIYEKQSGVESALDFLIQAPPGYVWKESKGPLFNYVNEHPPARLELTLTLIPSP